LYSESAIISKPPSTSRLPPSDVHEKVNFVYFCFGVEDYDGSHITSQAKDLHHDEEEDTIQNSQLLREEEERKEQER
jgi:hypothetical protein